MLERHLTKTFRPFNSGAFYTLIKINCNKKKLINKQNEEKYRIIRSKYINIMGIANGITLNESNLVILI